MKRNSQKNIRPVALRECARCGKRAAEMRDDMMECVSCGRKEDPNTEDYLSALRGIGAVLLDQGDHYSVKGIHGSVTRLDSEDGDNAAFEAWHMVKP
jgi:ribosomal protein L37E